MDMPLFPNYEEHMEAKSAESQRAYEVRWLKKLYDAFDSLEEFEQDQKEAGDEFGFHWYNENHPLPIKLYASRLKDISPAQILRSEGMTKTLLWRDYFECKSNHPKGAIVGMIFPVNAMKHFIMHNMFGLFAVNGVNRVVRQATNPDHGLIIEPTGAFFKALVISMGPRS